MTEQVYLFLTAPKKTKAEIACQDEKIENLRMMMLPSAIRYDKDKVQTSPQDPMIKYIERLSEMEEKRKALFDRYLSEQDAIEAEINKLDDIYVRQVLTMRYISCKCWKDIVKQMPFAERAVFKFHKRGIQLIDANMKSVQ